MYHKVVKAYSVSYCIYTALLSYSFAMVPYTSTLIF